MIPRIIHQIWLQGSHHIPQKFQDNVVMIKEMHPEWHYVLWDEVAILTLIRSNSILTETYYKLNYLHQKVDFARYIILYMYGGVYLDMDAYTIKPLDDIVTQYADYDLIVSRVNIGKLYSYFMCSLPECLTNSVIIAKKSAYSLARLIDAIISNPGCGLLTSKYSCIQNTTGTDAFSNVITTYGDNVKVLPYEYLEPCILGECAVTDKTIVVHKHANSWLPDVLIRTGIFFHKHQTCVLFIMFLIIGLSIYFLMKRVGSI